MRKILISYGYGAGWTSWNSGSIEFKSWLLTHPEIIEFIENGNKFTRDDVSGKSIGSPPSHPLLRKLQEEAKEKFDVDYVCVLGATGLCVEEVDGPVHIEEYDGAESYRCPGDGEWL